MTDTQVSGEAATVEPTITAPEAVFSSPDSGETAPPERNYEAEARDMGWVPEGEFKGDKKPAKFLDAKEFVERGETVLPFVQRENKRLKDELAKRDKDYEERFTKLTKATEATLKKQREDHERQLANLSSQREAALDKGDGAEVRKIEKQINDHKANAPQVEDIVEKPKADAPTQDDPQAVQSAWEKANPWYGTDDALTEAAIGISQNLLRKNPNISMAENLRQTDAAMKERFPLRFGGTPGANAHAPVDSGGDPKPPEGSSKTPLFDKLPKEAKALAEQAVKDGVYKSKEEWARVYNS
jgi:hypothetical protein